MSGVWSLSSPNLVFLHYPVCPADGEKDQKTSSIGNKSRTTGSAGVGVGVVRGKHCQGPTSVSVELKNTAIPSALENVCSGIFFQFCLESCCRGNGRSSLMRIVTPRSVFLVCGLESRVSNTRCHQGLPRRHSCRCLRTWVHVKLQVFT